MFRFFALLFITLPLLFTACGDDEDGSGAGALTPFGRPCTTVGFSEALNEAVTNLSNAATAFSMDATTANCEAYRNAANAYLDTVEDFEDCAAINQAEFQQSLEDAREAVADISC